MKSTPLTPQIDLTQLTEGQNNFIKHYAANGDPYFAPDLKLSWPDFKDAVENGGGISNTKEIALTMIHRFDGTNWFLTMVCCQMDLNSGKIIMEGNRFDLTNNGIFPSQFPGSYDPTYFAAVTCNGQAINPTVYINNVTIPWYQEVAELHCQNNLPNNDSSIFIKFSSCTYDYSDYKSLSLVPWPHTILFFMNSNDAGDYVDNAQYPLIFTYRAGDMGTLCPPQCNCYEWPASLPLQNVCLP